MYKNSRKIVFFAIAFLLSLTQFSPINIFGQELNTTSDLDFNYYYSDSNQQTVQKYNLEVNEEWNNFLENISVQPLSIVTEKRSTSVPLKRQERSNWCGPASVQMVLLSIKGASPSQSTLASSTYLNTDTSGTYVYKIVEVLKSFTTGYKYLNLSDTGLWLSVWSSLEKKAPTIYHVRTGVLPHYTKNLGHYVVGYEAILKYDTNIISPQSTTNLFNPDVDPISGVSFSLSYKDPYTLVPGDVTTSLEIMTQAIRNHSGFWIAK